MDSKTPENIFFKQLLAETEIQFKQSPVFHKQLELGKKWNYAVCATPIKKNKGIIFGINWGGSDSYNPQSIMPSGEKVLKYNFINRNKKYLTDFGLDFSTLNFNYSNLCFFRTPKENILEISDYELTLPLFEKYVRYINPSWLLSIGEKNMKILDQFGLLKNMERHYDNENKFKGHSAKLWEWNIFSVPHPSARMKSESREQI